MKGRLPPAAALTSAASAVRSTSSSRSTAYRTAAARTATTAPWWRLSWRAALRHGFVENRLSPLVFVEEAAKQVVHLRIAGALSLLVVCLVFSSFQYLRQQPDQR